MSVESTMSGGAEADVRMDDKPRRGKRFGIRWLIALVVVVFLGFVGSYVWDNYLRPSPSLVDQAIKHMEELVNTNPSDINLRIGVADMYLSNNLHQRAIAQYNEVLKVVPDHKGAIFGLGSAYMALRQDEKAISYLGQVIEMSKDAEMARLDKQLETAYYYLGNIYLDNGDTEKAIEQLNNALALAPEDADAVYLLGKAYQQRKEYQQAIDQYAKAVRFVPGFIDAYENLGECYRTLGDQAGVAYTKGMLSMLSGNYQDAIQQLISAVAEMTGNANAYWGLGSAYERTGDKDKALTAYRQALTLDPDHVLAKAGAGRLERTLP